MRISINRTKHWEGKLYLSKVSLKNSSLFFERGFPPGHFIFQPFFLFHFLSQFILKTIRNTLVFDLWARQRRVFNAFQKKKIKKIILINQYPHTLASKNSLAPITPTSSTLISVSLASSLRPQSSGNEPS